MRRSQRDFTEDFVIDPRMAGCRPGIGIRAREVAGLEKFLAEEDVTPQVGVNGVIGELKESETKNAENERTAQRETGWRRRHGGKVTAANSK